ncbi:hypothetical protein [Methylorubrum salsuginis]|uniref:Uncharacterized protein n=1 Tax=Methylorubrum salsuginis TaxID=414703 RepID=A0A1I4FPT5_9HYPH|nr:hypothetical protein [Methylorubrum salsuginis]SFL18601.1 hypothetical protein SAMN04488125_11099 [Methylorubrum salsuginis]
MKTVTILSDFSSYPNGKDERAFRTGEEPELSNEHADLLIGKGLARLKGSDAKPSTTKAEPAPAAEVEKKDSDA